VSPAGSPDGGFRWGEEGQDLRGKRCWSGNCPLPRVTLFPRAALRQEGSSSSCLKSCGEPEVRSQAARRGAGGRRRARRRRSGLQEAVVFPHLRAHMEVPSAVRWEQGVGGTALVSAFRRAERDALRERCPHSAGRGACALGAEPGDPRRWKAAKLFQTRSQVQECRDTAAAEPRFPEPAPSALAPRPWQVVCSSSRSREHLVP